MHRRTWLKSTLAAAWGARWSRESLLSAMELDALREQKVVQLRGLRHRAPRPKFVGKNAHLDDHGDSVSDQILLIRTDAGIEGLGSGSLPIADARRILGQTVAELWTDGTGSTGGLGRVDHALFDLVGKILGKPAWSLLGGTGSEWLNIYDGSIYFNDLLPEHSGRGVARLLDEVDMGLEAGLRAFKIKVGRGFRWMEPKAGFERDVDVVRAIRKHVGPDVALMVDANNGFTVETAKQWLGEVGDCELTFVEEMFPEQVDDNRSFREFIRLNGWKTRVADGENARDVEHFDPFLKARVLDILQPDIRAFGLSLQWAMARRMAELDPDARLAPHNWGSLLGLPMQVTLGRGLPQVVWAEMDRASSELIDLSAYRFENGRMQAPNVPGCGIVLNEAALSGPSATHHWAVRLA